MPIGRPSRTSRSRRPWALEARLGRRHAATTTVRPVFLQFEYTTEAVVSWASAHETVDAEEGEEQRPRATVVVDAVAANLRGEYVTEEHASGRAMQSG